MHKCNVDTQRKLHKMHTAALILFQNMCGKKNKIKYGT